MGLHHVVCIYLYGGCYLFNAWENGAAIAYLHDIADITSNITRMLAETKYTNTLAVLFVFHIGIWFYTRNYMLC
jgi:hypothetical protein